MTAAAITQLHLPRAAQLPVQLKCTLNFQRAASCWSQQEWKHREMQNISHAGEQQVHLSCIEGIKGSTQLRLIGIQTPPCSSRELVSVKAHSPATKHMECCSTDQSRDEALIPSSAGCSFSPASPAREGCCPGYRWELERCWQIWSSL